MERPDEFTQNQPSLPNNEPRKGAWPQLYNSPLDAVLETLERIRRIPIIVSRLVPEDSLPPDLGSEKLKQLHKEVRVLMKDGTVGESPYHMVSLDEFLLIAPQIFDLDEDEVVILHEEVVPSAKAWLDNQFKLEIEQRDENIERSNGFLLETWNTKRFKSLMEQLASVPENQIPNIATLLERFKNVHLGKIETIGENLQAAKAIEDVDGRRNQLKELAAQLREIVSQLTYLTHKDISKISEREQTLGYLFLDSLKAELPILYRSAAVAKRKESTLNLGQVSVTVGRENELLDQREAAINNLVYGAKDNHSTRSTASKILKRGRKTDAAQYTAPKE